jgi:hypothetical protein
MLNPPRVYAVILERVDRTCKVFLKKHDTGESERHFLGNFFPFPLAVAPPHLQGDNPKELWGTARPAERNSSGRAATPFLLYSRGLHAV